MKKNSYVACGFVHPGNVHTQTAITMAMNAVTEKRLVAFCSGTSARINRARTSMIEDFLKMPESIEWLWLIDGDMVLPIDALKTLLETAETKKRRIVGGLAYIWQSDIQRILPSIIMEGEGEDGPGWGYITMEPPPDEPRFIEAKGTGAFCLLVHRSIFVELSEHYGDSKAYPWFDEIDLGKGNTIGADLRFFDRAREICGERPLIDTSVRCGHIKEWTLTHEEAVRAHRARPSA